MAASPETHCSICLEDLSDRLAILLPCGHLFHMGCATILMRGLDLISSRCPLCRADILAVVYEEWPNTGLRQRKVQAISELHDEDEKKKVHVKIEDARKGIYAAKEHDEIGLHREVKKYRIGHGEEDNDKDLPLKEQGIEFHIPGAPTPDTNPFIRPDESISVSIPDNEKERRRSLRRLRAAPDYFIKAEIEIMSSFHRNPEDGTYTYTQEREFIHLNVTGGERPKCRTRILRTATIWQSSDFLQSYVEDEVAVDRIVREIYKFLEKKFSARKAFRSMEIVCEPQRWVDERGLACDLKVTRWAERSSFRGTMISSEEVLEEKFPRQEGVDDGYAIEWGDEGYNIMQTRRRIREIWDRVVRLENHRKIQRPDNAVSGIFFQGPTAVGDLEEGSLGTIHKFKDSYGQS